MDTLTLNSDQVEKIRKYVEEEFDKNELQALQGINSFLCRKFHRCFRFH